MLKSIYRVLWNTKILGIDKKILLIMLNFSMMQQISELTYFCLKIVLLFRAKTNNFEDVIRRANICIII